uniref:Phycobilisome protein n=1 Tax=Rhodosorus marinus TaxID=101924 RepID=A0A7S3E9P9_9RHOD|mmetsp:Transcript_19373/g.77410  ORF Transcript_19373/g.77410 Transcript_19373/m.77410 type:complete len:219 (+) Transcript_19373:123-779(+)
MAFIFGLSSQKVRNQSGSVGKARRVRIRSSAVESGSELSEELKQLFQRQKERPIFDHDRFGGAWLAAENELRFFSDEELTKIGNAAQRSSASALRDGVESIVAESREKLLKEFPNITEEGGALYPPFRSEACWRDFWHFTRVASYGCTIDESAFLNKDGLGILEEVYRELSVPLDAMLYGTRQLKVESQRSVNSEEEKAIVGRSFDTVITGLSDFVKR